MFPSNDFLVEFSLKYMKIKAKVMLVAKTILQTAVFSWNNIYESIIPIYRVQIIKFNTNINKELCVLEDVTEF